jgi:predicted ATP-grasp superfamily ATP-dependent carboligase
VKDLRILITTVGGTTSPDIIRSLKNNTERDIWLIGTDPIKHASGRYFIDEFQVTTPSFKDENKFVSEIRNLVNQFKIDAIIPCGNEDNLALAKHRNFFKCPIMVGDYISLCKAYDKGDVYKSLNEISPEYAPNFQIVNNLKDFDNACDFLGFPQKNIVVKPRFGRGGRGVFTLTNFPNLKSILSSKPSNLISHGFFRDLLASEDIFDDLIVMEELLPPFHSSYTLINKDEVFTLDHIREWGGASQTLRGLVNYDEDIEKFNKILVNKYNLKYTFNIELATNNIGNLVLFDLNPRIGASSGIDSDLGVNFPYLSLKLLLGETIDLDHKKIHNKRFVRYFDYVWAD